jgi:CBS domain-containing protein
MTRPTVPVARDLMVRRLRTLSPQTSLFDAVAFLLRHDISGAPVVDDAGRLLGLFSELDCLRALAAGEFYDHGYYAAHSVGDLMSAARYTIPPDLDLFAIAGTFVTARVRRLPVVDDGRLVGMVGRRDMLAAIDRMRRERGREDRYPDYPKGRKPG